MSALTLNNFNNEVNQAAKKSSEATGRKEGNLEDQLRVANELLRGLEILNHDKASALKKELEIAMQFESQYSMRIYELIGNKKMNLSSYFD